MARTANLQLPLVQPSQAQKHVTVNEAFSRLDATAQLRVVSSSVQDPPASAQDGQSYLVPSGASGIWAGRVGQIAVQVNGGWIFLEPKAGWRAWDESIGAHQVFDGTGWIARAIVVSARGAATVENILEFDHTIVTGATNSTSVVIPKQAQVVGITGRVIAAVTGTSVTGWRIGVSGAADRYGTGLGKALNSYVVGLSGAPVTYYADTPLLISAEGGSFSGGKLRIAVHLVQLVPPRTV